MVNTIRCIRFNHHTTGKRNENFMRSNFLLSHKKALKSLKSIKNRQTNHLYIYF